MIGMAVLEALKMRGEPNKIISLTMDYKCYVYDNSLLILNRK
jgi:hypothetical protein